MPKLEEIEDIDEIDNMDFDPNDFDPRNPFSKDMPVTTGANLRPVEKPSESASTSASSASQPRQRQPQAPPQQSQHPGFDNQRIVDETDLEEFKNWQVIYPIYFDKNKTHKEGRRVSTELAVENPLAQNIANACKELGIHCIFESNKTHPKDWANPGRIRVLTKADENNIAPRTPVNNKRHLYRLIASYLQTHPTTKNMAFNHSIAQHMANAGIQPPEEPTPLAIPKGWKINNILPIHSRTMGGGGQNKEMMENMQKNMFSGLQNNMPDGAAAGGKPKKVRVKK